MQPAESSENKPRRGAVVITTHINADFDALASMLAASKLYPGAMLVFPGSQERNLRNFYVESACYLYNFVKVRDVDFEEVGLLVLVDTRQADRIGPLAELARRPDVEVHAYDHHPDTEDDVKASRQVVESVGATVTLLTGMLKERGVELTSDEATIMSLGIYEDTGNFTFPSTTAKDHKAAAWLLEQGANLNTLASLITRELNAEEVGLLNDLIHSSSRYRFGGLEVVVSEVSRERYVPDFAVLVHKFMDMDNLEAIFALARMEGRVYLVARSRSPNLDAGAIAKALGGGGHPTAASATIKEATLVEARNRLMSLLKSHIDTTHRAADLMSGPAVSIPGGTTMASARKLFNRYGLEVFPVTDGNAVTGLITRYIVDRAIQHGLGAVPVRDYMDQVDATLGPDSTLAEVEDAVVGQRRRLVPVVQHGALVGVITRTDILNALLDEQIKSEKAELPGHHGERIKYKQVGGLMRERIPGDLLGVLKALGKAAAAMHAKIFLVGGSVRDLLLRRPILDLDVVVEGDGMNLALEFAQGRDDLRVRTHKKFRTAKMIFEDGQVIDVATARLEYYDSPASLPSVELSSLKLDLYRRDFTINTLAVSLNPGEFGKLIDFFGATRDLKDKAIRVLHNLSFVEDPTRVFRAVRFEQRFGFRIGKLSEGLIKNALKINAFQRLSGARLFSEIKQMFEEERAVDCFLRLGELDLLGQFHPKLEIKTTSLAVWQGADDALAWYRLSFLDRPLRRWLVYFLALADPLNEEQVGELCTRLGMGPKLKAEIRQMRSQALYALHRFQRNQVKPSTVHRLLENLRTAYQLFIMAKTKREWVKKAVSQHLTTMINVRPALTGKDLLRLGFKPGPRVGVALERLLQARLDGQASSREDELAILHKEFADSLEKKNA